MDNKKYLENTKLLNYEHKSIQKLIAKRGWKDLSEFDRIKAIYNYVRDEIRFGYNVDDAIPASKVLKNRYGQCNTKGTLFMALLRACGIPCRIHGFTIDKELQKGAMTGFVYKNAPRNVFHSWVEVFFENKWYELEGFILDTGYLNKLQEINSTCEGAFCGYGVAVKDFKHPVIDFDRNNTYIQSEGINQDFGVYDSPDELLKEHGQELSGFKKFAFRHLGRHLMNRNVRKVRRKDKGPVAFVKRKTEPAREFMRKGRAGGMIAETVLTGLMSAWVVDDYAHDKLPLFLCFLIAVAVFVIISELTSLMLRILLGRGKRCRSYFYVCWIVVTFMNVMGTQFEQAAAGFGMSYLLVLAVDVVGRIILGFVRTRRFKQVFAYVAAALSIVYLCLYGYMIFNDNFGESRIEFYNQIERVPAEQAQGFDEYLQNGPYEVNTLSYGPDETDDIVTDTLDFTIYDSIAGESGFDSFFDSVAGYDFARVPVKGQIWYPEGLTDCPVFFMVHGNHDSDVPSYMGYDYIGEYLASNGYVVISVDENIINASEEGNDKRAILLLENMRTILDLNDTEGSSIFGLIDEERIAIGGHSRGGEMVSTAYLFNELDHYPEDGNITFDYHFNITSIVAIAPCVDQYRPVGQSVEISDVNYLIIHGANDQDVSTMMGEKQYNNITFTQGADEFYFKSSVYVLGANHGQFNTQWGQYDSPGSPANYLNTNNFLEAEDQELIARAYIRVFLDCTLNGDDTYASLMSDVSSYTDYLPDTVYITNYSDSNFNMICSFDHTTDISNSVTGAAVDCSGMDTWTIDSYDRGNGGESEDHVLYCSWEEDSEPSVTVEFAPIDISEGAISFAIADLMEDTEDITESYDYSVELTDQNGNTVTVDSPVLVYHSLAVQLARQDCIFGGYEYKHQQQTVTVTPSMFDGSDFDFTGVVSITITADGQREGQMIVNNIGYWSIYE